MTSFSDRYRNSQHIRRQASEDDFTDPAFVTGAVLAQIEDLDRDDKIAVLEGILTNTPNTSDAVATYDFGDPDYVALAVQAQLEDLPLSEQHAVIRDVLSQVRKGASKTAITLTEWSVSVTSPNRWMSTPGVWDGHPNAILNVHKTVDEPNEFGGIGKSVKHPEYDGLTFDSVDEAWAFAESKGLVSKRGSKTGSRKEAMPYDEDVQWSANQPPSDRVYLIDTNVEPIPYRPGGGDAAASFLWPRAEAERAIGEHRPGWRYPAREIADPKDGWYVSWGPSVNAGGDNYWNLNNRNFARREARQIAQQYRVTKPVTGSRKTATDPYGIWATTPGATGIAPGFEGQTYKPYRYTPDNTTQPGRNWAVIVELPDGDIDFMADGLSAEEAYEDAKRWNAKPFLAPDHSQFHDDTMFGLIQGSRVANEIMGYEDEKELEADEPENMVPVAASLPAQNRVSDWRRTAELTAEDCIDSADGTCSGEVEYRMPLSSSGKSFPRCHRHWLKRLDREQDNPYPDSPIAPSWFDPAAAGERWDDDY